MAPPPKYKYKSKDLQKMQKFYGEEKFNKHMQKYGSGGLYGISRSRDEWSRSSVFGHIEISPEISEALERKEFGPGAYTTYKEHAEGRFHDIILSRQVKKMVAENPALAVELGFTKKTGRKLPKNKKEAVKLLLDIKSITDTPGSAEALGIDLTQGGMTPAHWEGESEKKFGRVAYAYQGFEGDIKEYQDIERMESKIEPLKIRRTTEDKIMDSWKKGNSKSNIIGK